MQKWTFQDACQGSTALHAILVVQDTSRPAWRHLLESQGYDPEGILTKDQRCTI